MHKSEQFKMFNFIKELSWIMYVALFTWFLIPFYVGLGAPLLPMTQHGVDQIIAFIVASSGLLAWRVARRGGPLLLSEPEVLYGLVGRGSPAVAISVLLRQSTYFAVLGGSFCAGLGVMESQTTFSFSRYLSLTGIGVVSAVLFVQLAVLFAAETKHRWAPVSLSVSLTAVNIVAIVFFEVSIEFLITLCICVAIAVPCALFLVNALPADNAWKWAAAFSDLHTSISVFDIRGAIYRLRSVADGPRINRSFLQQPVGPSGLWRATRSVCTSPRAILWRVSLLTIGAAISASTLSTTASQFLMVGVFLLLISIDLTASISSTMESMALHRGLSSVSLVLGGHVVFAVLATTAVSVVSWVAAQSSGNPLHLTDCLGLAFVAAIASSLQARFGSPDLARLLEKLGPQYTSYVLGFRSVAPLVFWFLGVTFLASQTTHNRPLSIWLFVGSLVVASLIAVQPPKQSSL